MRNLLCSLARPKRLLARRISGRLPVTRSISLWRRWASKSRTPRERLMTLAASEMSPADGDTIVVTVKVDDNFHVNANPASFDFLIPTSVEFKGVKPSTVEYPKAMRFTAKFAPEGLDVYEGSVRIVAKFPKDSLKGLGSVQGTVTVQACTNQIWLPPSELSVSAGSSGQK